MKINWVKPKTNQKIYCQNVQLSNLAPPLKLMNLYYTEIAKLKLNLVELIPPPPSVLGAKVPLIGLDRTAHGGGGVFRGRTRSMIHLLSGYKDN